MVNRAKREKGEKRESKADSRSPSLSPKNYFH
jgi:hypothetical protein